MPVTTRQAERLNLIDVSDQKRHEVVRPAAREVIETAYVKRRRQLKKQVKSDNASNAELEPTRPRPLNHFGLVQELYQHNLYHLVVQAILWNQTRGKQAIIVLRHLLEKFPTPFDLSLANEEELANLLHPIGLFRQRAKRLIALGREWIAHPPQAGTLHKVRYKCNPKESFWEIAHLPGIGKYAIDSYRIFHRDQLLGLSTSWDDHQGHLHRDATPTKRLLNSIEPEWKRVSPDDKDLFAFTQWAWKRERANAF